MKITTLILATLFFTTFTTVFGQKGKDGTLTQSGTSIVNEFTTLSSDVSIGNTTINVASSTLNSNGRFSGNLEAGDLIIIIQMQGADINGSPEPWTPGTYGLPIDPTWGQITNYNNCGNNEYAEVKSIPNGTSIELRCGLTNNYTSSGSVQIIRVPRYIDLTINGTLTTEAWNGSTGGVLAIEVDSNLIINGSGEIEASELGFRGSAPNTGASLLGVLHYSRPDADAGGLKGEGIRGWGAEYDLNGGRYSKGSPANGGGGGTAHNGGGGGGGNAGNTANWNDGVGVPNSTYNTAWALETPSISGVSSSGGGRGGYTFSGADRDANSVAPADGSWGGDNRQNRGGLGGRPLDYSTGRIFLGGGGGAGDLNEASSIGGGGGNGGGIVYILNYGTVSGTGNILSNGAIGEDVTAPDPGIFNIAGNDGAGGGGAGGTVIINSNGTVSGISVNTDGGIGGDQIMIDGGFGDMNEAEGPGGGGGGGYIAISNGAITTTSNGGLNGVTNSGGVTEFPPNGATSGGIGLPNETISNFFLSISNDTICSGTASTLATTVNGTLPGGTTITWYDAEVNGNIIGTNTFTTGNLTSDTTFYVGTCPGNYLIPVSVIISPPITFNDASIVINDENCGLADGSITGIIIAGGTAPLTYAWNSVITASQDLSTAGAGSYTLIVSDSKNCSTTVGTYAIANTSSLALDVTGISITNETCGMANGLITGITTSGGTLPYTYTWNLVASADENLNNANANSYTLEVTDNGGCTTSSGPHLISNIAGPVLDATGIIITDESCTQTNGSIIGITFTGGTAPISYDWSGTPTLSIDSIGLAAGNYTLTVTDASGCTDQSGPYLVIDNTAPLLDTSSVTITNETCGNLNGSITDIATIGGNAPFTYSWNGNTTLTADTSALGGGTYSLTITDALGCSVISNPITVDNIGLTVDTSSVIITNDVCTQGSGSIAGILVSGGNAPYTYTWNGAPSLNPDTANLFTNSYVLTITDFAGCTFTTNPYTVLDNSGPVLDATGIVVTDESCTQTNGSIIGITVTGGTAPISYDWSGMPTLSIDSIGLAAGNYTLTVTDASGCTDQSGPYLVIDNTAPLLDTSSVTITNETCGNLNGSIIGIATIGGNAPFTYSWNGITTLTADTSALGGGTYSLTITDALGCSVISNPITVDNIGLTVDTSSVIITNDVCTQGSGSIAGILVSGGNAPYTYAWNGAPSLNPDTANLFTNSYVLTITDFVGCTFTTNSYTVIDNSGPVLDASSIVITPETCAFKNGEITGIVALGGTLPLTYLWNGINTTTIDTIGLAGTNYILIVTDANGCTATDSYTVNAINGPSIDTSAINIIHEDCYASNGSISGITITNGTAPFIYNWNGTDGNIDTSNLSNGGYILTVTDNNGCIGSLGSIIINNSGAPIADFTLSSNTISLSDLLSITNNSSVDAINFSWDFNDGTTSPLMNPSVTYSNTGTYSICLTASTATNCPTTICQTVTVIEEIETAIGIPLAFSPNNDTHNDMLYVRGSGINSLTFIVYNRYGEKVFETNDIAVGWDGTYKGKDENTGVFVYYIEYELLDGSKESLKGNVTLVR